VFKRPEAKAEESKAAAVAAEEEKGEMVAAVISHVSRPPASNDVQAFIEHIVAEMGVTTKYRWSEARMNQLWTNGQQWKPPMMDTDVVLRNKVMCYVRAQEAAQDPLTVELS